MQFVYFFYFLAIFVVVYFEHKLLPFISSDVMFYNNCQHYLLTIGISLVMTNNLWPINRKNVKSIFFYSFFLVFKKTTRGKNRFDEYKFS